MMTDDKLLELLAAQATVLAAIASGQMALERVVFALIETHPDKHSLLHRVESQLEADAVDDLSRAQEPEQEQAALQQRARMLARVRRLCAT
jgi:hypothetical protein